MAATEDVGDYADWTAGIAERKIQDAMEEGLFENLPGRGQPLDLSTNPFEPPGMGAINRLLKHNKALPPWLLLEKEIEASRAFALGTLAWWEATEPGVRGSSEYPRLRATARATYQKHLKETNDLILKYNLSNPFNLRAPVPFLIKRRLAEFDAFYGTMDEAAP